MDRKSSRSHLVPHIIRRLLQPRVTVAYPKGPLKLQDSYRGQVVVDIAACVGCGRCARACPSSGLEVTRSADREGSLVIRVRLQHDRCGNCGLCELSCPRDAIHLAPRFASPVTSRQELVQEWVREEVPRAEKEAEELVAD
ncbi:MAG: 4Fe-4S binding protein [Chloroflexi bacterium]|nr:4Fe-4S binding protein [Chloroflexota bacterium]